ncbi:hypothetical protein, partial [Dubosiella newyorkensis]|uniref:hypothetical protein n=1 Tax=Dubosiella newyorkensis TaxID=1862672 RepID=UPI003F73DC93
NTLPEAKWVFYSQDDIRNKLGLDDILCPASALNRVDFPTFGLPTTATIGFLPLSPIIHLSIRSVSGVRTICSPAHCTFPDPVSMIKRLLRNRSIPYSPVPDKSGSEVPSGSLPENRFHKIISA